MKPYQPPVRDKVRRVSVEDLITLRNGYAFDFNQEITVEVDAWIKVCQHAGSELRREVGGLLMGAVFDIHEQLHVVVQDVIPAKGTVNSLTSVEFTLATWKQLLEEKAAHHGDEIIVGWYHSHPGFGLFLSSLDQFIHHNFFPRPWHLALVVDPVAQTGAFFLVDSGKLNRRDDFSIRTHGNATWNTGKTAAPEKYSSNKVTTSQSLPSGLISEGDLRPALMLDQYPDAGFPITATAASVNWLCVATASGQVLARSLDKQATSLKFTLPGNAEVHALALDDNGILYILSRLQREIWSINLSRREKPQHLEIDGYVEWKASLPAGLFVCQKQILMWDWNKLLFFRPDQSNSRLVYLRQFEKTDIRVGQVLRDGNYHLTAAEDRLYINNPQQDRIEILAIKPEIEYTTITGGKADLRSGQAITFFQNRLFVLDSEGTRILCISLEGVPQEQYLLQPDVRNKHVLALVANQEKLFLVTNIGLYEIGISNL